MGGLGKEEDFNHTGHDYPPVFAFLQPGTGKPQNRFLSDPIIFFPIV
jgi:hypothetical protein